MAKSPAWTRKEGKNPNGGLNAKGRRSAKAEGHDLKPPQPEGGSRRDSFCARMKGLKKKLTSSETANDPDSRVNKSLRAWNCADGGVIEEEIEIKKVKKDGGKSEGKAAVARLDKAPRSNNKSGGPIWDKPRPKSLGKPDPLSKGEKSSAKAAAKAAGRPYPNLIDNMNAAKKK
jgi:hypothetical protein